MPALLFEPLGTSHANSICLVEVKGFSASHELTLPCDTPTVDRVRSYAASVKGARLQICTSEFHASVRDRGGHPSLLFFLFSSSLLFLFSSLVL